MKRLKKTADKLKLSTTTLRHLSDSVGEDSLKLVVGGSFQVSNRCGPTHVHGGCP